MFLIIIKLSKNVVIFMENLKSFAEYLGKEYYTPNIKRRFLEGEYYEFH